ncbi:hypothetical protein IKO18_03705 [bacterium]|nr:hypothetical protein [bacterium]
MLFFLVTGFFNVSLISLISSFSNTHSFALGVIAIAYHIIHNGKNIAKYSASLTQLMYQNLDQKSGVNG